MSTDVTADVLNRIMNAKKSGKKEIVVTQFSKVLIGVLDIMKQYGHIEYQIEDGDLKIRIEDLNECRAIKPRFTVNKKSLERYLRRFLPSRNFGVVIVSTNKGMMTHYEAQENKIGGSLIAYFY